MGFLVFLCQTSSAQECWQLLSVSIRIPRKEAGHMNMMIKDSFTMWSGRTVYGYMLGSRLSMYFGPRAAYLVSVHHNNRSTSSTNVECLVLGAEVPKFAVSGMDIGIDGSKCGPHGEVRNARPRKGGGLDLLQLCPDGERSVEARRNRSMR